MAGQADGWLAGWWEVRCCKMKQVARAPKLMHEILQLIGRMGGEVGREEGGLGTIIDERG